MFNYKTVIDAPQGVRAEGDVIVIMESGDTLCANRPSDYVYAYISGSTLYVGVVEISCPEGVTPGRGVQGCTLNLLTDTVESLTGDVIDEVELDSLQATIRSGPMAPRFHAHRVLINGTSV